MICVIILLTSAIIVTGDKMDVNYNKNNINDVSIINILKEPFHTLERDSISYEPDIGRSNSDKNKLHNQNYGNNNDAYVSNSAANNVNYNYPCNNVDFYSNKRRVYRDIAVEDKTEIATIIGGALNKCPKGKVRLDWRTCVWPEELEDYYEG